MKLVIATRMGLTAILLYLLPIWGLVTSKPQFVYIVRNSDFYPYLIKDYYPIQSIAPNLQQNYLQQQSTIVPFHHNAVQLQNLFSSPMRIEEVFPNAIPSALQFQPHPPLNPLLQFWNPNFSQLLEGIVPLDGTRVGSRPNNCYFYHEIGDCVANSECVHRGGNPKSQCGHSIACCIFVLNCGSSTNAYSSYFRNTKWPISDALSSSCQIKVEKADENICGLRIDIRTLSLPASTGYCDGISLSAFGVPGKQYESICGSLDQTSYDIAFGPSSSSVYLEMKGRDWLKLRWDIHISQRSCSDLPATPWPEVHSSSEHKPPQGPPPTQAVSSPGTVVSVLPPGISGTPDSSPATPDSDLKVTIKQECGLIGTRSIKPGFRFRNYGQLPMKTQPCLDHLGRDLCPHHELNPLTRDLEWDTPLLNDSLLYKYSGRPIVVSSRITFGRPTEPHEFPWVVAMYSGRRFHCGASLISERHILTAAHCVIKQRSSAMKLSIGDWDINSQIDGQNLEAKVSKIVVHPGYSSVTLKYDIAVLTLVDPVQITDFMRPICLPAFDIPLDDNLATVTGWGRNEENKLQPVMMKHSANIVSNSVCTQRWIEKGGPSGLIADTMMCMDPQDGDSCKGDSGGPATMEYPPGSGKYIQVGIVSFGSSSCTDKRLPGVYTNVGKFLEWIRKQMV